MAQAVLIPNEKAIYSENILPYFATFNQPYTFNIVAGGSNGVVEQSTTIKYAGDRSIKVTSLSSTNSITFDANSELETTIVNTGNYVLSCRLYVPTDDNDSTTLFNLAVYVNGILLPANDFVITINDNFGKWVCYSQILALTATDVVNFQFKSESDKIGSELYIDGLQLNYDDRSLSLPPFYSFTTQVNTGWARYLDSTYTSGSPLTILSGVRATLTNNALDKLETQLPSDTNSFFNEITQKILATNNGDAYNLSIRFKAKISVNNGYFDIDLDIGGSQGIISQESILFTRALNTEQKFDIDLTVFAGSTFVANGGTLSITPQNGDMEIYDISFVIVRTHKAI